MSSNARHRAPGRAKTPLTDLNLGKNATAATVAVTAAGVGMSTTPAHATTSHPAAKASTGHRMTHAQLIAAERTYSHFWKYHRHQYSSYRSYLARSPHFHKTYVNTGTARTRLLRIMRQYTGIYYRWGGTTPAGFDCSGFTQYVYRKVGYNLPRLADAQRNAGYIVSRSAGRPGDLVWMPGHVGIYLGNGMMFDSPRTGKAIGARPIWSSQYQIVRVLKS